MRSPDASKVSQRAVKSLKILITGTDYRLGAIAPTSNQFSILDLRFWIASPAFSGLLVIPFVAPLKRIDVSRFFADFKILLNWNKFGIPNQRPF
jgi:hypothetical protein